MNSLIALRSDDFSVESGSKGNVLCTGIKGRSLVLFYSPNCKICSDLLPKFKHLPEIIPSCKFCVLNINQNQGIIAMAKQTIAPIEFVPYIILYVNGRPFLQYDDTPELSTLVAFLQYSLKLIDTNKSFVDRGARVDSDVPKYSIARPYLDFKCDPAGFCLLNFEQAYGGKRAPTGVGQPPNEGR